MKKPLRLEHIPLYARAAITGIIAGFLATAYRITLEYAGKITAYTATHLQDFPFLLLLLAAVFVFIALGLGLLTSKMPLIKGSGIPQVKGVLLGVLKFNWLPELLAKFFGGFMAILCGLSLGREGPSIQLGAFAGDGIGKTTKSDEEKQYLLTAGACAGLAAAFGAPMAGIIFAFEELGHKLSHRLLVCATVACICAEIAAELILGQNFIFTLAIPEQLPVNLYASVIPLGIACGLIGALFNGVLLFSLNLHGKIKNEKLRPVPAFLTAAVFFAAAPQLLGSGGELIPLSAAGNFSIALLALLIVAKILYVSLCYGSGVPGGIFFPLLVLGALTGKLYNDLAVHYLLLPSQYSDLFIILGMTALFTAVVRAPLTGCILLCEMCGSLSNLLPLLLVSITAYTAAEATGNLPIYTSLLNRLLQKKNSPGIAPEPQATQRLQ